jgi:hypothetical protein
MRIFGLLLTALLGVGCVGGGDAAAPPIFDPCAPLVIAADADATTAERAALGDAVGLWRAMSRVRVTTEEVADAPHLYVAFRDAPLVFFGIYETAGIAVNRGLTDPAERAVVLAHEMGHAFGLEHVTDGGSVMHPGNLTVVPGPRDAEALAALWGACPDGL